MRLESFHRICFDLDHLRFMATRTLTQPQAIMMVPGGAGREPGRPRAGRAAGFAPENGPGPGSSRRLAFFYGFHLSANICLSGYIGH
jgi:hypothetical protein